MHKLYPFLLILSLFSCKKETKETKEATPITTKTVIDVKTCNDLFKILPLIPNESMDSWEWTVKDRTDFISKTIKNGFVENDTSGMFQKKIIDATHFRMGVIDGYWEMKLYPLKPNHYIILTKDVVGDGTALFAYEYKNNKITKRNIGELFPKGVYNTLPKKKPTCKKDSRLDLGVIYSYYFHKNSLQLYNNCPTDENDCYYFDSTIFLFNNNTGTFDIKTSYWENELDLTYLDTIINNLKQHKLTKNKAALRLIRNGVFAQKGYVFNDLKLQYFFKKQYWYEANFSNENFNLTAEEKATVNFIKELESNSKPTTQEECIKNIINNLKKDSLSFIPEEHIGDETYLISFIKSIEVKKIYKEENAHLFIKKYYFHKDWDNNPIDNDECEDSIRLRIDFTRSYMSISIDNCAIYNDGEVEHAAESSLIYEFNLNTNCEYQFKQMNGAG